MQKLLFWEIFEPLVIFAHSDLLSLFTYFTSFVFAIAGVACWKHSMIKNYFDAVAIAEE